MKVLITADIHIDDYSDYNFSYHSRLNQFNKLAERLVEIGHQYNCKEHWILGDIINRPNSRKYIEHVAKKFLETQLNNFENVRFILGQHDLSAKSQEINIEDTLEGLFDYQNLIYMDKKILEIDNHIFGFMNWRPEANIDFLGDKHADILFAHFTKSNGLFYDQANDIDESKFDLMIHGDIHNTQVIGKYISVGTPLQHDMRCEAEGDCIIFDTETLDWERVKTDPDHTRFLQIYYTKDRSEEGFKGPLSYYIYKPDIDIATGREDLRKSVTWNDIDDLVHKLSEEKGILDINDEVQMKCVPYSEVDFNFQLNKVKIHGYRSIVDMELDFNRGDKVALLGDNGSGKSSIIGALQNVFNKNRYLGYEQSDMTEDVWVYVSITYQNKVYELTKGSIRKFVIDGQEQTYNNLTELESDVLVKLPFLNYLDLFFINSNVNNLSAQFNPTRRIELISKFYRLDRISAYCDTASNLKDELTAKFNDTANERNNTAAVIDMLNERISELSEYKDQNKSTYIAKLEEYKNLRDNYSKYETWNKMHELLLTQLDKSNQSILKIKSSLNFDCEVGENKLTEMKETSDKLDKAYNKLYEQSVDFERLTKERDDIYNTGIRISKDISDLENGVCPTCGTKLADSKNKELLDKKIKDRDDMREKWIKNQEALDALPGNLKTKNEYIDTLNSLRHQYKELQENIEILTNKINEFKVGKSKLETETENNNSINKELEKLNATRIDKPRLPVNLDELENKAHSTIAKIDDYLEKVNQKELYEKKLKDLDEQAKQYTDKIDKYDQYIELTSTTGEVYEKILTKLAESFSTPEVKYEVESGIYRNNRYINFNSYYLVRNKYKIYESCSDGQRIVCDLDFLSKLFSVQVGLLVLDEYLKALDYKNFPKACDILSNMNVNTVILSTHDINLTTYTKRILLSLDDEGRTQSNVQ